MLFLLLPVPFTEVPNAILLVKPIHATSRFHLTGSANGRVSSSVTNLRALPAFDVFNIGAAEPVRLLDFIQLFEKALNKKALLKKAPFQPGDVHKTHAEINKLSTFTGYRSRVGIKEGISRFVEWHRRLATNQSQALK